MNTDRLRGAGAGPGLADSRFGRIVRQQHFFRRCGRTDQARLRQFGQRVGKVLGGAGGIAVGRALQTHRVFGLLVRLRSLHHGWAWRPVFVFVLAWRANSWTTRQTGGARRAPCGVLGVLRKSGLRGRAWRRSQLAAPAIDK